MRFYNLDGDNVESTKAIQTAFYCRLWRLSNLPLASGSFTASDPNDESTAGQLHYSELVIVILIEYCVTAKKSVQHLLLVFFCMMRGTGYLCNVCPANVK